MKKRIPDVLYHHRISKKSLFLRDQDGTAISPATISNLSSGEFVGIMADDPDCPIEWKGFHARIANDEAAIHNQKAGWKQLPMIRKIDGNEVEMNFQRIRTEVQDIMKKVIAKYARNPEAGWTDQ